MIISKDFKTDIYLNNTPQRHQWQAVNNLIGLLYRLELKEAKDIHEIFGACYNYVERSYERKTSSSR